jgi:hypothetical protein
LWESPNALPSGISGPQSKHPGKNKRVVRGINNNRLSGSKQKNETKKTKTAKKARRVKKVKSSKGKEKITATCSCSLIQPLSLLSLFPLFLPPLSLFTAISIQYGR